MDPPGGALLRWAGTGELAPGRCLGQTARSAITIGDVPPSRGHGETRGTMSAPVRHRRHGQDRPAHPVHRARHRAGPWAAADSVWVLAAVAAVLALVGTVVVISRQDPATTGSGREDTTGLVTQSAPPTPAGAVPSVERESSSAGPAATTTGGGGQPQASPTPLVQAGDQNTATQAPPPGPSPTARPRPTPKPKPSRTPPPTGPRRTPSPLPSPTPSPTSTPSP